LIEWQVFPGRIGRATISNYNLPPFPSLPVFALLAGASMWGIVWYPYRLLAQAGVGGELSSLITYGIASAAGLALFPRAPREWCAQPGLFAAMGLAAGVSNVSYILGVLEGNIMRVVLLFYLAPLWTIPLAHWLLGEKLAARGYGVMAVALMGAAVMLWRPELGAPWPASKADWLGVAAGMFFALCNVLVRKAEGASAAAKSQAIWLGVTLVALPLALGFAPAEGWGKAPQQWPLLAGIGFSLVGMSLALQYGLSRLPATRAVVILLFELVVAAAAAWLFAGEVAGARDWIGGALIVLASLLSGFMGADAKEKM
jgi:drug/metabolite transporter (DMT)-like permease